MMIEQVLFLLIGAVLAVGGGFFQSWYNNRSEIKNHLREKREETYLGYIEALFKLREDNGGAVRFKEYFESYNIIKAKLKLYGSKKVRLRIIDYEADLYECFEIGFNVNDVIKKVDEIIDFIRNELEIK